ncbi:GGDEF domain-containing protein [Sulfurimonas autotrophica]|uniref:diguanylate cyclase n=1 Tax=Sulfurimonas autotrophica (strain ATCC BAA-671 / DSM 16294 / JCM 11897 / OK10) TaxID=563040 RepID=E0URR5_SULAO|nr:sensor domain-containing diguanylate cyclase [Sulfurimonas autotrophica]ADN10079.1 diguanylate cyclase with PAS/PAC sensor [Sulfurimonas autotrophica DSM 16294]
MKNSKNKFFMIGIIILLVWVFIEAYFYSIAVDAQKNYTNDLLKQAQSHYNEINNIRNLPENIKNLYVKKNNEFVKVDPDLLVHSLLKKYQQSGFYYTVTDDTENNLDKSPSKYIYSIDKKTKRLKYFYDGIALDMDAAFYIDRMNSVWLKFFLVSLLFTTFTFTLIFLIRFLAIKSVSYRRLSNTLEDKVKEQTQKLDLAFEGAGLGYWHWNIQTHEHEVDERWLQMLGLEADEVSKHESDWESRVHPFDYTRIMPIIQRAIKKKKPYVVEFRMLHRNGEYVWIQSSGAVTKVDENGDALELSGTHQEISKRKKLEQVHAKNELYLKTLYEKNPNIIIISTGKKIIQANEAFFHFFKEYASLEEFKQEYNCICHFFSPSKYEDTITSGEGEWIDDVLKAKEPMVRIYYLGQEYYFSVYVKKIYEENAMHVMATFNDITDLYKLRHEYEELSIKDALTSIYNRRYFNTIFPRELNRAKRAQESFCFAIMDVDHFKLYNDNYGHDGGDEVLKKITAKIEELTQRSNEFFFRLGGEEFGFICSALTKEEVLKNIENMCKAVEDLEIEHLYNKPYGVISISVGICFSSDVSKSDVKNIYKNADEALYEAKEKGRNRVVLVENC